MSSSSKSSPDDAESVSSAIEQAPSNPGLLRPDLVAAILGSSPTAGPAPISVPIPAQELVVKKKKNKLPPVKILKAMKEIKDAKELLNDKVDLTTILNEEECKFLAEKLWIVTAQQLESVLHPQSEDHSKVRQDLIEALAASSLVPKDIDVPAKEEDISMDIDELNNKGGDTVVEEEERAVKILEEGTSALSGQDVDFAPCANVDDEGLHSVSTLVRVPSGSVATVTHTEKASSEFSSGTACGTSGEIVDSESLVKETSFVKADKTQCSPTVTSTSPRPEESGSSEKTPRPEESGSSETTPRPEESGSSEMRVDGGSETVDTSKPDSQRECASIEEPKDQDSQATMTALEPGAAEGAAEPTPVSKLTESSISSAMKVMEIWSDKLMNRSDDQDLVGINEKFFLDGPVSFLFPQCTRNFLKSAKIDTVYEFLCLKRTESGVIVDAYEDWRKKCDLSERPRICIAKHLVALGVRLEALIGSNCPLFGKERQWLSGHTIVLGGSSKEFLFEIGVLDAKAFVTETTKRLSYKLAVWRGKKGLPPLKGTGKVAMISAWKTQIREAQELELHAGQILGDEWAKSMNILKSDASKTPPSKKRPRHELSPPPKKLDKIELETKSGGAKESTSSTMSPRSSADRLLEAELASPDFLDAIFEKDVAKVMASIGITNGKELLSADTTPYSALVDALSNVRKDVSGDADPEACINDLLEWQKVLNLALTKRRIELENRVHESTRKVHEFDSTVSNSVRIPSKRKVSNPWDILSDGARAFLVSIDVTDAETFLAGQTKYLAERLVTYRENHNLAPLRGSGAVASVSGWKALVRNAASDLGKHELANLNAGRNAGIKLKRRKRKGDDDEEEREAIKEMPNRKASPPETKRSRMLLPAGVQLYIAKTKFWVRHAGDAFCFDLSVRQSSRDSSCQAFFLTYLGSEKMMSSGATSGDASIDPPVLDHIPATSGLGVGVHPKPFLSLQTGLIDLERYGIEPPPQRDHLRLIRKQLNAYISQEEPPDFFDRSMVYNVFERRGDSGAKYYFFSKAALEKGQTVELNFLPQFPSTSSDVDRRKWIKTEMERLQASDLRNLLEFINEVVGTDNYTSLERIFTEDVSGGAIISQWSNEYANDTKRVVVARRRIHWLALKIEKAFEKADSARGETKPSTMPPLWNSAIISSMSKHPLWQDQIRKTLVEESRSEILAEFRSQASCGFWTTQEFWCSVANKTFNEVLSQLSQFNAERESFCSEEELIDNLAKIVTEAVLTLRNDVTPLDSLLLNFDRRIEHSSNMFPPTKALWVMLNQNYLDGMALAGDPPFQAPVMDKGSFLAVKKHPTGEGSSTEFRSFQDFDSSKETIDLEWYVQAQVVAVVESVAICSAPLLAQGFSLLSHMSSKILERVTTALGGDALGSVVFRERLREEIPSVPPAILDAPVTQVSQPESRSLFLHLVWPSLRKLKWRIEAGNVPSSVTYLAPGQEKDKRARVLRKEAAIARGKVAKKTTELGLGGIPKDVKRLLVTCTSVDRFFEAEDTSDRLLTTSEALRYFQESFSNSHSSISATVEHIQVLFEDVAPSLLYKDGTTANKPPNGMWRDVLGCEYLVRLLFVLPRIVNHADFPVAQVESTMGVVKELLAFLASNRGQIFVEEFQYPHEEYANDFVFKTFIQGRLEEAALGDGEKSPEIRDLISSNLKEIVLPSDRHELTDFVTTVMDQVLVCRATQEDVRSRGRRSFLTVGAPGLVCRHCLGHSGEGKYFYSNMQSLATASTSLDKHILRCPKISDEIRNRMLEAKSRNAEQRSKARPGAQSAFFARLWTRLQQARSSSSGVEADMYGALYGSNPEEVEEIPARSSSSGDGVGFRDHIDVLRYIQAEEPWKSNLALNDAISNYYRSLAWGAGVFHTPAMPSHYSSEWVLAKLGYH